MASLCDQHIRIPCFMRKNQRQPVTWCRACEHALFVKKKKEKGNILFIFFHVPFSDNQWIHNSSVSSHSFVRSKLMNLSFPQIFFSVIKRAIYWLPKASKKGWPERRYRMSSVFKRIHDKIMLIDCIKMDKILASFFSGSWYFKHHWPFNY